LLISVAVPVPFLDELTYRVPDNLPTPPIGARVRVPVGSRTLTGCVVGHDPDPATLAGVEPKPIVEALDAAPYLPAGVIDLCRWVSDYWIAPIVAVAYKETKGQPIVQSLGGG
jgi:primosomal protein N' (replication factor Y)